MIHLQRRPIAVLFGVAFILSTALLLFAGKLYKNGFNFWLMKINSAYSISLIIVFPINYTGFFFNVYQLNVLVLSETGIYAPTLTQRTFAELSSVIKHKDNEKYSQLNDNIIIIFSPSHNKYLTT